MRISVCIIAMALLFASCSNDNNNKDEAKKTVAAAPVAPSNTPTADEQKGIKEITDFYNGQCKYSAGLTAAGKRYVEVLVSNSITLDSSKPIAALCVGNIALQFYKNLTIEKQSFDEIHAVILYPDSQRAEKDFSVQTMDTVASKTKLIGDILDCFRSKNYDALLPLLNDQNGVIGYDKRDLIGKIKEADAQLGDMKDYLPYGFIFYFTDKGREILHVSGTMMRTKQKNQFSIDIDPAETKEEAIIVNYKL